MYSNLRSLIFKLDPEKAHTLAIQSLKFNLVSNVFDENKNDPIFKTQNSYKIYIVIIIIPYFFSNIIFKNSETFIDSQNIVCIWFGLSIVHMKHF